MKAFLGALSFFCLSLFFAEQAYAELSLIEFLNEVEQKNLMIKMENSKVRASEAEAIGIRIPSPMVSVSQMREEGAGSAIGFEVNQSLPFPTKVLSDRSARKYENAAQAARYSQRKNEILVDARMKFVELWAAQERLQLFDVKRNVLKEHLKISRSQTRSDSFATVHLLRAESDFDLLGIEMENAQQVVRELTARLAEMIDADPAEWKVILKEPPESSIPSNEKHPSAPNEAEKIALKKSSEARVSEARSAWLPDLSFRYKEMGSTSMSPKTKEIMLGLSVPLYFWQPYAENAKASAEKMAADYELQQQRRSNEASRTILLSKIHSLKKQVDTLKTSLIPRAEKRVRLTHGISLRDMESLQNHRETMEALPELQMKALDLRLEFERSVAEFEKIYGIEGRIQ